MVLGYICRHIQYVFDITMGQRELRHVFGVYTTDIQYMPHMYSTYVFDPCGSRICDMVVGYIPYMPHTYVSSKKTCDVVVGYIQYILYMPHKYVSNS